MVCDSQQLEIPLLDRSSDSYETFESASTATFYDDLSQNKGGIAYDGETNEMCTKSTLKSKSVLIGAVLLIVNTVSAGSVTPLINALSAQGILLKFSWRFLACMLTFSLFAFRTKKDNGEYWTLREMFFSKKTRVALVTSSCWVIWMATALYASLVYTFMIAEMFANMTSVFILAYRLLTKSPVKRGEIMGVVIALVGAACTFLTPQESGHSLTDLTVCILVATFGAFVGAIYLLTAERIGDSVPLDVLIFVNATYGYIVSTSAAVIFEGAQFFSISGENGVFGLFASENLILVPFMSIVCGILVIRVGFVTIQYVGSLIVSVTYLIIPGIVAVESYFLGFNGLPNWSSVVSTAIMSVGLLVLIMAGRTAEPAVKSDDGVCGDGVVVDLEK